VTERFNRNEPQLKHDWEAVLVSEGMPTDLPESGIPSGDALDITDPSEAQHRSEEATLEQQSETVFDQPDAE
jgi:hypothetical protein